MKIQILSDVHIEVSQYTPIIDPRIDVLVLAGDIGVGLKGLEWAAGLLSRFDGHIIYVPGNHEFYRHELHAVRKAMRNYVSGPVGWTGDNAQARLHVLDNSEVVIERNGEKVRFVGGTLWTDFELFGLEMQQNAMIDGERCLRDFHVIEVESGDGVWNYTAQDSINLHNETVKYLECKLKHEPFDGATVVVTHHAPSWNSVVPRYQRDILSSCFASKLEDRLLGFSEMWIHGHMHASLNYEVAGTRVVCNPRGYSRYERDCENADFAPCMIWDVQPGQVKRLDQDPEQGIEALLQLEPADLNGINVYAIGHLPQWLQDRYRKDRKGSAYAKTRDGQDAIYAWDFEPWRRSTLRDLGYKKVPEIDPGSVAKALVSVPWKLHGPESECIYELESLPAEVRDAFYDVNEQLESLVLQGFEFPAPAKVFRLWREQVMRQLGWIRREPDGHTRPLDTDDDMTGWHKVETAEQKSQDDFVELLADMQPVGLQFDVSQLPEVLQEQLFAHLGKRTRSGRNMVNGEDFEEWRAVMIGKLHKAKE